jgi:hypothetical protein
VMCCAYDGFGWGSTGEFRLGLLYTNFFMNCGKVN